MDRRRRVPRQSVAWIGKHRITDDVDSPWADCQVVDISILGVGLQLLSGPQTQELIGRSITIEVNTLAGASVSIRLVGEIRHVSATMDGRIRAGIEFVGLTDEERAMLETLESLQIVW